MEPQEPQRVGPPGEDTGLVLLIVAILVLGSILLGLLGIL